MTKSICASGTARRPRRYLRRHLGRRLRWCSTLQPQHGDACLRSLYFDGYPPSYSSCFLESKGSLTANDADRASQRNTPFLPHRRLRDEFRPVPPDLGISAIWSPCTTHDRLEIPGKDAISGNQTSIDDRDNGNRHPYYLFYLYHHKNPLNLRNLIIPSHRSNVCNAVAPPFRVLVLMMFSIRAPRT